MKAIDSSQFEIEIQDGYMSSLSDDRLKEKINEN
jgi:hypothetical protein